MCVVAPKDVFGRSPLHAAAENGHVTCVEQLCVSEPGHVNDRDERGLSPLHLAAREIHRCVGRMTRKRSLHLRVLFFLNSLLVEKLGCLAGDHSLVTLPLLRGVKNSLFSWRTTICIVESLIKGSLRSYNGDGEETVE